jgi:hypothetical protein
MKNVVYLSDAIGHRESDSIYIITIRVKNAVTILFSFWVFVNMIVFGFTKARNFLIVCTTISFS